MAATRMIVVAVRDSAMQAFANPIVVPTIGVAIRSFSDEVNRKDPQNQLHVHPEDFELWHIANWLPEEGYFENPEERARCIARGKDVTIKEQ